MDGAYFTSDNEPGFASIPDRIRLTLSVLGGFFVGGHCTGRIISWRIKDKTAIISARTSACGHRSLFELPYDSPDRARLCAVCDRADLMPRFR